MVCNGIGSNKNDKTSPKWNDEENTLFRIPIFPKAY